MTSINHLDHQVVKDNRRLVNYLVKNVMKPRKILHVDLDAFFCSVEQLLKPDLKNQVFVVGGSPEGRGVVTSASYRARKYGIRSAMPTTQALRLYPDLIVVSSQHRIYSQHSRRVMALLKDSAPVVEQLSIDEAFLDVSDDQRPGKLLASSLQTAIRKQFDLPTSWGVAINKLVAKIATEVGKPNGMIVVPPGKESEFLAPLPVEMLWGVGPKTRDRLAKEGVKLIGELAALPEDRLSLIFGDFGMELAARAKGVDVRPVREGREPRSMSAERTFAQDLVDVKELSRVLLRLSERVGHRLRKSEMVGMTVKIKLRWSDFTTITRQIRLSQPTDQDGEIYKAAMNLFEQAWRKGRPVRLLGVGVSDLGSPVRQLTLFDQTWQQDDKLLKAIDSIRGRYGMDALRRAESLRVKTRGRRRGKGGEDRG